MPQTLVLRLPAPGQDETEWLTLDEQGMPATMKQRGPLSLAAAVARSAKVTVLAPATQILLAEPDLPPGSGGRLARAVPFALEEQLTEDIDQLSFAIGRRRANGNTPVAVVSRTVLEGWISELSAAGIEPAAMYADMSLLPENPGQTVMWLENERLAVRRPGMLPFAVELSPVTEALIVAGVIADPLEPAEVPKELENAILYVTREDWTRVQDEFESLLEKFESLKIQILTDGPLPWLARELGSTEPVNLLQGDFARGTDYGERWREWRTAAVLAGVLLLVHLTAQALQIRKANHESAVLDGQMSQIFSIAMPGDKMVDPRRQMQAQLDRIRKSGAGPQYFLHTLQVLGGAMATSPKATLESMSYRERALDVKLTAPDLAALSAISQVVGKQGLTGEIKSSTPTAAGIEANMQFRSPGTGSGAHK
jgi:general secretion pathway protein L